MDFKKLNWHAFPITLIVLGIYLAIGFSLDSEYRWNPTWLIFFAIPLYHWSVDMIKHKRIKGLPTFIALVSALTVFVVVGLTTGTWHPTWLVFFAVPITGGLELFFSGGVKAQVKKAGENIKKKILDDDDIGGHGDIE